MQSVATVSSASTVKMRNIPSFSIFILERLVTCALTSGDRAFMSVVSCFCEVNSKRIVAFAPVAIEYLSRLKQGFQSNKQKQNK